MSVTELFQVMQRMQVMQNMPDMESLQFIQVLMSLKYACYESQAVLADMGCYAFLLLVFLVNKKYFLPKPILSNPPSHRTVFY